MPDPAYTATLTHLFGLRRLGARPGLEVMRALLGVLGEPQKKFRSVHVAGSKGKGSVAVMTAAILAQNGRRTGLFTSPHMQSFRERIRVDGTLIPSDEVVAGVDRIQEIARQLLMKGAIPQPPTFFEVTTALAFDYFARQEVPQAIIEVGLGGRLDSTNVIEAPVAVITTIEYEHQEVLGPTLRDIAREKAGILSSGASAIVGDLPTEAWDEVQRAAKSRGIPVWHLGREIRVDERTLSEQGQSVRIETPARGPIRVKIPLHGTFQATNAALAVAAADLFARSADFPLSDTAIRHGLSSVVWRGRLERVDQKPDVYVDVAHTEESARAVTRSLAEICPFADPVGNVIVFGCLQGKRVHAILDALVPLAQSVVIVPIRSDRMMALDELRRAAIGRFPRVVVAPSVDAGYSLAQNATEEDGIVLVTGSDYLVGEVLNLVAGEEGTEPDLSDPAVVAEHLRPASSEQPARGGPT